MDGFLPCQDFWEQELQRERDNPTYLRFLHNSLKSVDMAFTHATSVEKDVYKEWCLQADPKRFHKFKSKIYNKNGVRSRVICKNWVFLEQATSNLILPEGFLIGGVPLSKLGAASLAIRSRTDLTEEQKEEQCNDVFNQAVVANQTGNHYRNHYIRARNPYGHD